MSQEMKIGVSNFDGGFAKKETWRPKANENNLFRVLPPLFSLADKGQYAKYYATHTVFLSRMVDGKPKYDVYQFNCLEKTDKQTKVIEVHCPFCDVARENKATHENAKTRGATKDQLDEFFNNKVRPFQNKKEFYVNAVNLENKVGVLVLSIKAFQALQDRLKEAQAMYSIDATGTNGLFMNFKKTQKFVGDRDTVYSVDLAMDTVVGSGGIPTMQLKQHVITKEFIEVIRAGARDLGSFVRDISADDMKMVIASAPEAKKDLLDKIFGRGEKKAEQTADYGLGGTNAVAVAQVTMNAGEVVVKAPEPIQSAAQVSQAPVQAVNQPAFDPFASPPPVTPSGSPVAAPVAQKPPQTLNPFGASPTVSQPINSMNDEQFLNIFGGTK